MFSEPPPSPYDLRFRVFDVPVRVHPMFWLVSVLLGPIRGGEAWAVLAWVFIVFVSILVHELGHVLANRYYGTSSHIVLHSFGGLAISDGYGRRDPRSQLVISLAGPAAGFVFAAVVIVGLKAGGVDVFVKFGFPYVVRWDLYGIQSDKTSYLLNQLLYVNIFWGLVNLLPIYPLDGGQATRAGMEIARVRDAVVKSLWLSVGTAAVMAVYCLRVNNLMATVFFAYLAYNSYQMLQSFGGGRFGSRW